MPNTNTRVQINTAGQWHDGELLYTTLDGHHGCRLDGEDRVDEWHPSLVRAARSAS